MHISAPATIQKIDPDIHRTVRQGAIEKPYRNPRVTIPTWGTENFESISSGLNQHVGGCTEGRKAPLTEPQRSCQPDQPECLSAPPCPGGQRFPPFQRWSDERVDPKLSLIIPFHDVELFLADCLNSVASQEFEDCEVLLIDDGSTDGSREIAEDYAGKDARFQLVRQDNRGPGAARNRGAEQARGQYIAFVDADDMVTADAYVRLVGALEESGSDIACGGVQRFDSVRRWPSPLHEGVFDEPLRGTHITRRTALLKDRTVWNKVYRHSFWRRRGLAYPEHPYEDGLVAVSSHVLADAVDLLSGTVYFWRQRDKGPLSITQRTLDLGNLDGRMKQVRTVSAFLRDRDTNLKDAYDLAALQHDVLILLMTVPHLAPVHGGRILSFAQEFSARASDDVLRELDQDDREIYSLLWNRQTKDLLHLLERRRPEAML